MPFIYSTGDARNLGSFHDEAELITHVPFENDGSFFAFTEVPDAMWKWDANGEQWVCIGQPIGMYIPYAEKGAPEGVATLGVDGKIPIEQLPDIGIETFTVAAGEDLLKYRMVCVGVDEKAYYASNDDLATFGRAVAITKTDALTDDDVTLLGDGVLTDAGWTWTPSYPIYLDVNGELTQIPPAHPAALYLQEIGTAITSTIMKLEMQPPIKLA